MTTLGAALQALLAAMFLLSASAKLVDLGAFRQAVAEFGVPRPFTPAVALTVPVAELAVAGLLLTGGPIGVVGAGVALVLLAVFTAAITWNLRRGRNIECRCFGQLGSSQISWRSVVRNLVLLVAVVVALAAGPYDIYAWLGRSSGGLDVGRPVAAALIAILIVVAVFGLTVLRRYGAALVRLEQLENAHLVSTLGSSGPRPQAMDFAGTFVDGKPTRLYDLLPADRATLLVFMQPGCGPCAELVPDLVTWGDRLGDRIEVVATSKGTVEQGRHHADLLGSVPFFVQPDETVLDAFDITGTPGAVLVSPDATVLTDPVFGVEGIRRLVSLVAGETWQTIQPAERRSLLPGEAVPAVEVSSPEGDIPLAEVSEDSVLVFWDPECVFASAITDDLVAFDRATAGEPGTTLVVVSSGDRDKTLDVGFTSVLLDGNFDVGRRFGVSGTPSAVALREGRLASLPHVGGDAVLDLLSRARPGALMPRA